MKYTRFWIYSNWPFSPAQLLTLMGTNYDHYSQRLNDADAQVNTYANSFHANVINFIQTNTS